MTSRVLLVFVLLSGLWVALFVRGAYLQIIPNEKLAQLQRRQFATTVEVSGRRGLIVDRYGRELAASLASQSLFVDPHILERPRLVARRLAKLLNLPQQALLAKFKQKKRRFIWLKRHLTEKQVATIKQWDIRGLGLINENRRVYPNNQLLAQTLGFVGREGDGLEGLELRYNQLLNPEHRVVMVPRDARGRPLLGEAGMLTNVNDGARVELTIDSQLQFILEKELRDVVQTYEAEGAVGMVMDPQTGEILAMAANPTFNANNPLSYSSAVRRNRVITDVFEAGSVLKTMVLAAAIRDGVVKPSTIIDCSGGRLKVGDRWIREADEGHEFGRLTVSEILAFSSNVGTAKVAMRLGDKGLRQALLDFGFGQKLDLDLPGEAKGILQALPWNDHLLSNISFGHGIAVTPLQVATAFSAIANGGMLKKPFLVRKIQAGEKTHEFTSQDVRRVLSEEQASTLKLMLRAATMEHATGEKARIAGFPVAGKTGTAQKVDLQKGGYLHGSYISSFAGFVPANSPKFVIYVAVDNPKKQYYAAHVAAPVFAQIAQYAVRQAGLTPVLLSEQNLIRPDLRTQAREALRQEQQEQQQTTISKTMPNLNGLTLREVYARMQGTDLQVKSYGRGVVSSTIPAEGAEVPANGKIRVFLQPVE